MAFLTSVLKEKSFMTSKKTKKYVTQFQIQQVEKQAWHFLLLLLSNCVQWNEKWVLCTIQKMDTNQTAIIHQWTACARAVSQNDVHCAKIIWTKKYFWWNPSFRNKFRHLDEITCNMSVLASFRVFTVTLILMNYVWRFLKAI